MGEEKQTTLHLSELDHLRLAFCDTLSAFHLKCDSDFRNSKQEIEYAHFLIGEITRHCDNLPVELLVGGGIHYCVDTLEILASIASKVSLTQIRRNRERALQFHHVRTFLKEHLRKNCDPTYYHPRAMWLAGELCENADILPVPQNTPRPSVSSDEHCESQQGLDRIVTHGLGDFLIKHKDVQNTMHDIREAAISVTSTARDLREKLDKISDSLLEFAKGFKDEVIKSSFEGLAHLLVGFGIALVKRDLVPIGQAFMHYGISLGFKAYNMLELVSNLFPSDFGSCDGESFDEVDAQAGGSDDTINTQSDFKGILKVIPAMLTFALSSIIGLKDCKLMKFLKIFGDVGRHFKGIGDMVSQFDRLWSYCRNKAYLYMYGKSFDEIAIEKNYPQLESAIRLAAYFSGMNDSLDLLSRSRDTCLIFRMTYHTLLDYRTQALAHKHTEIAAQLSNYCRKLERMSDLVEIVLSSKCEKRVPPVVVKFFGTPGSGKTFAVDNIIDALIERVPDYNNLTVGDLVFSRKVENEFWDGFKPTNKIIKYDDFGQMNETSTSPGASEHLEIIRLANSDAYLLHMAKVELKNNTYAKPDYVMITTNDEHCVSKKIKDQNAFKRRIDFDVCIEIQDEFRTFRNGNAVLNGRAVWFKQNPGCTDQDALQAIVDGTYKVYPDYDVLRFRVKHFNEQSEEVESVWKFDQLVKEMMKEHEMKKYRNAQIKHNPAHIAIPAVIVDLVDNVDEQVVIKSNQTDVDHMAFFKKHGDKIADKFFDLLPTELFAKVKLTVQDLILLGKESVADLWSEKMTALKRLGHFFKTYWPVIAGVFAIVTSLGFIAAKDCPYRKALKGSSFVDLFACTPCGTVFGRAYRPTSCKFCLRLRQKPRSIIRMQPYNGHYSYDRDEVCDYVSDLAKIAADFDYEVNPLLLINCYTEGVRGRLLVTESENCDAGPCVQIVNTAEVKKTESHQDRKLVVPKLESHQDRKLVMPKLEKETLVGKFKGIFDNRPLHAKEKPDEIDDHIKTHMSSDGNTSSIVRKLLATNVVKCRFHGNGTHAMVVKGRHLLINNHFVEGLDTIDVAGLLDTLVYKTHKIVKIVPIERKGTTTDFSIIELDKAFTARPNIIKHFPEKSEIANLPGLVENGYLRVVTSTRLEYKGKDTLLPLIEALTDPEVVTRISPFDDAKQRQYELIDVLKTRGNTAPGMCGSPVVLYNTQSRFKILAAHAAGSRGVSYAQLFTQADFDCIVDLDVIPPKTHSGSLVGVSNVLHYGIKEDGSSHMKSSIRPSPLFGLFPVKTKPADLSKDRVLPNLLKVTKPTVFLSDVDLEICKKDVISTLCTGKVHCKRVLTDEEAISGIEGEPYLTGINRSTSAGYPYMKQTQGKSGKTKWMGDGEWVVDNPELRENMRILEEASLNDVLLLDAGIFTAALKDETRPIEKVDAGKTRVVCASNMVLSVIIRKYFLGFLDHVMRNKIDNEIGLGMNVYSDDWEHMVRRMRAKGDNIVAGDFSNFDGSLNAQILFKICDVINAWYGDEFSHVRLNLFEYLVHSTWLVDGKLIQLNHSQPSGNPLTTLINCMYNMFIFRYSYLQLQDALGYTTTLKDYRKYVNGVFYGDDSIISIARTILPWFNQISISCAMEQSGHVYTDETKQESLVKCKSLDEVTFLKRSFYKCGGTVLAALEKDTIYEMVMWKRRQLTDRDAILQTTRHAGFEAYLHGKDFFDHYQNAVDTELTRLGMESGILTWREYDMFAKHFRSVFADDNAVLSNMLF